MPYMFTDLSKVRGHLSEDKVQFLVYQMLCGLRVSWGSLPFSIYHEASQEHQVQFKPIKPTLSTFNVCVCVCICIHIVKGAVETQL